MAKSGKNYYDILGVLPSASMTAIKRAYRQQARRFHPDLNPGDPFANQRFSEMREAYEALRDGPRRTLYDHSLGFKSARWTESVPDDEDEGPEEPEPAEAKNADAKNADAKNADAKNADPRPDPGAEPLGPRSDAARAAAEAMRQRIRAQQRGFESDWARQGPSPGAEGPEAAWARADGPDPEAGPRSGSTGPTRETPRPGRDPGASSGAAGGSSARANASTGASGGNGSSPGPQAQPTGARPAASAGTAGRTATTASSIPDDPSPVAGAEPRRSVDTLRASERTTVPLARSELSLARLRRWLLSPAVVLTGFFLTSTMSIIALIFDPDRAAFFAVLAIGVLLLKALDEIKSELDRLQK